MSNDFPAEPITVTVDQVTVPIFDYEEWRNEQAENVADYLCDELGREGWHYRAGSVCRYTEEVIDGVRCEWYCKLTPIANRDGESRRWDIRACYRLDGMTGYNHVEHFLPIPIETGERELVLLCDLLQGQTREAFRAMANGLEASHPLKGSQ